MKKKQIIIGACLAIFIIEVIIGVFFVKTDMSNIGKPPHKVHEVFGVQIPFGGINVNTVAVSWGIMILLVVSAALATYRMKAVPGRLQCLFELIVESFDKICHDTLGDRSRIFMPYVTTLFLFILCCNWVGIIPLPHVEEPTADLNTTLGLGFIAFFVCHIAAIRYKGLGRYVADYFEPMIEIKGVKIPNVIFAPINLIGEIGKLISHSFRLYGNILGGAIIMQVISNLTHYILLPVGLNLFFGLFVGAVQAFVFAMLALTYISVLVEG